MLSRGQDEPTEKRGAAGGGSLSEAVHRRVPAHRSDAGARGLLSRLSTSAAGRPRTSMTDGKRKMTEMLNRL